MTKDEEKKIAYDMGRLMAWQGRAHIDPGLWGELLKEWERGVESQCKAMREAAAKIPLTWSDQNKPGARAD